MPIWSCSDAPSEFWSRTMENTIIGSEPTAGSRRNAGTPGTLREAAQEFESLFIAQMMKSMRGTVPQSGLMGSDSGQGIFREMLDQELSRQVAFAGGFGIGDMLYQQLKGNRK
jgi:Rod binding domain-containing protein